MRDHGLEGQAGSRQDVREEFKLCLKTMELHEAKLRISNEIPRADRLRQAVLVVEPVADAALKLHGAIGPGFDGIDPSATNVFLLEMLAARRLDLGAQAALVLGFTGSNALELERTVSLYSYYGRPRAVCLAACSRGSECLCRPPNAASLGQGIGPDCAKLS